MFPSTTDLYYYFFRHIDQYPFLLPLGAIGLWRWSVWVLKELLGKLYRPKTKPYRTTVSIVTPVYNEDPRVFSKALASWDLNNPSEIIAVIDYTDIRCIGAFRTFAKTHRNTQLIITKTPGKRPALADGIRRAKSEIVALVDSDTLWGRDVITKGLSPFNDPKVGGVGTYQSVLKPTSFAQKVFDTHLDIRYTNEFPFLAATGNALTCLSGRTAFYRRDVVVPLLDELVNETFLGRPVISGDDKALTYMVLRKGWKVAFQNNTTVYTPGMTSLSTYVKQRIRWSRNALRADLKAFFQGWTWHHPSLIFFQIDKIAQTFVLIVSPIFVVIYLARGMYIPAFLIVLWWLISRAVKMYAHLMRRPQDIVILPAYIIFSLFMGFVKIFSFATLNTQGWITRWDTSRAPKIRLFETVSGYGLSFAIIAGLAFGIFVIKNKTYFVPVEEQRLLVEETLGNTSQFDKNELEKEPELNLPHLLSTRYIVATGDTLSTIAQKFGVTLDTMLAANVSFLTNWNRLETGTVLSVPGPDTQLPLSANFNYQRLYPDFLRISYDSATNTIFVAGRGQVVNLKTIQEKAGSEHLSEIAPKEWLLNSSIYFSSGVRFNLDKEEVTWLKMKSDPSGYAYILGYNTMVIVNGVKITSWDQNKNEYDTKIEDGRAFIMVKDGSRMDITQSELAYLGFARTPDMTVSPYGVSWKMSKGKTGTALLTGEIIESQFHHNYFGAYTYGATGMLWKQNKFYNNTRYGLDPHDDSNGFLITDNEAYQNGTHGIILSKRCRFNTIINNYSHDNQLHGIMLHESSNDNVVLNNRLINNRNGIALWRSSNTILKGNTVIGNQQGIRLNVDSNNNTIVKNDIQGTTQYAIYFYDGAIDNRVFENVINNNAIAVYLKTNGNIFARNTLSFNKVGVYFLSDSANNKVYDNAITYNSEYGIYSKLKAGLNNQALDNELFLNRRDVYANVYTDAQ